MEIKYTNTTITLPNSWDEITLDKYLDFSFASEEITGEDDFKDTLATYKLVGVICDATDDQIDDLLIDEMNDLSLRVNELVKSFNAAEQPENNHMVINGKDYACEDPSKVTNGLYISINILKERYANDRKALFSRCLAMLVRPATKVIDAETGIETWVPEKFNKRDIENLEWRANELLKASAKELVPVLTFFLRLTEAFQSNIATSSL